MIALLMSGATIIWLQMFVAAPLLLPIPAHLDMVIRDAGHLGWTQTPIVKAHVKMTAIALQASLALEMYLKLLVKLWQMGEVCINPAGGAVYIGATLTPIAIQHAVQARIARLVLPGYGKIAIILWIWNHATTLNPRHRLLCSY